MPRPVTAIVLTKSDNEALPGRFESPAQAAGARVKTRPCKGLGRHSALAVDRAAHRRALR